MTWRWIFFRGANSFCLESNQPPQSLALPRFSMDRIGSRGVWSGRVGFGVVRSGRVGSGRVGPNESEGYTHFYGIR